MVGVRLDSSVVPSVLRMSKAAHGSHLLFPVRCNCGSPRQESCGKEIDYYSSYHPARGGVDEKGGNSARVKCGWEDVVFELSCDTGCALMSVGLALQLVRRFSALG